jgi:hypothetical protein
MRKGKVYIVSYGRHLGSEFKCSAWADAAHYIKYCLDNGYEVTGVRVEEENGNG